MKFENADGTIKFEIRGVAHYQKWLSHHDAKIRKQTIDEFQKWYTDLINNSPSVIVPYTVIFDKLEQMKGEL